MLDQLEQWHAQQQALLRCIHYAWPLSISFPRSRHVHLYISSRSPPSRLFLFRSLSPLPLSLPFPFPLSTLPLMRLPVSTRHAIAIAQVIWVLAGLHSHAPSCSALPENDNVPLVHPRNGATRRQQQQALLEQQHMMNLVARKGSIQGALKTFEVQKREVKTNNAARRLQRRFRAGAACQQRREQREMSCVLQARMRRLWIDQRVSLLTGHVAAEWPWPACALDGSSAARVPAQSYLHLPAYQSYLQLTRSLLT